MRQVMLSDNVVDKIFRNVIKSIKQDHIDNGKNPNTQRRLNTIECDINLPNPYELCSWEWWQYAKLFEKPFQIEKILKSKMQINLIECWPNAVVITLPVSAVHRKGTGNLVNQVKEVITEYCKNHIERG